MSDRQEGIRSEFGYANRKNTVSDFTKAYQVGIRGASDIDYCYEKNGKFLFLEGKTVIGDKVAHVSLGQAILLNELSKKSDIYVFLAVHYKELETDKNYTYYVIDFKAFHDAATRQRNQRGQLEVSLGLEAFLGPLTLKRFWRFVYDKQQKFEK